jgi:hypothetical protein
MAVVIKGSGSIEGSTGLEMGANGTTEIRGQVNVAVGSSVAGISTATQFAPNEIATSNRNLIKNGEMRVAQRGASVTTGTGNFAAYTLDQWKLATYATDQLNITVTQEAMNQAVPGFAYFLKASPNAAETALAADEYTNIRQTIEAQDLQRLKWGTASAESLTLSFWVKCSTTGTAGITFNKHDATAYYITRTYTINTADTWEKKTVTIPGLTASGIANDTGIGLNVYWFLSAGSDYTSSDSTSWVTTGDSKYAYGHAINLTDSTSDYLALTGVQLEVGEVATSFEHEDYQQTLNKCLRYYEQFNSNGLTEAVFCSGYFESDTNGRFCLNYYQKRAQPTLTFSAASTFTCLNTNNIPAASAIATQKVTETASLITVTLPTVTSGDGRSCILCSVSATEATIKVSAEL